MKKGQKLLIKFLEYTAKRWSQICISLFVILLGYSIVGMGSYYYIINQELKSTVVAGAATDLFGLAICFILYISVLYERKDTPTDLIFFGVLVYMESALLCFDILCFVCNGNIRLLLLHQICIFLLYVTLIIMLVFFWGYIKYALDELENKHLLIDDVLMNLAIFIIAMQILNLKFGFLYTFDATGTYHRNNFIVSVIGPAIMLILIAVHLMKGFNKTKIRKRLLVYTLLPLIFNISQLFDLGFNMMYISNLFVLILCFNNVSHQRGLILAKKNEEIAKADNERLEYQTAIMISEIQPHFLYNSLGAINMLIDLDPKRASEATGKFSRYLRGNLDSIKRKEPILFSKELEHIANYLYLEKMRFDDIELEMDDIERDDFLLPSLSIQPIVENAIKHGIMGKEEGGKVMIIEREEIKDHVIQIIDNGIGFDPLAPLSEEHAHIGIENVKNRLKKSVNGTLDIQSTPGIGTTVTIRIPK